jgi:hypothetical protein
MKTRPEMHQTKTAERVAVYLEPDLMVRFQAEMTKRRIRSASNMAAILIEEALDAREGGRDNDRP